MAACTVHQGPGLTNATTGLTEAAKSRTPLLVLAAESCGTPLELPDRPGGAGHLGGGDRGTGPAPATAVADAFGSHSGPDWSAVRSS